MEAPRARGGRPRAAPIGLLPQQIILMTVVERDAAVHSLAILLDSWVRHIVATAGKAARKASAFWIVARLGPDSAKSESHARFSTTVNNMPVFPLVRALVHPAGQYSKKCPQVEGHVLRLSARYAKLRRSGYRKSAAQ